MEYNEIETEHHEKSAQYKNARVFSFVCGNGGKEEETVWNMKKKGEKPA